MLGFLDTYMSGRVVLSCGSPTNIVVSALIWLDIDIWISEVAAALLGAQQQGLLKQGIMVQQ